MKTRPKWRLAVEAKAVKLLMIVVFATLFFSLGHAVKAEDEKPPKSEKGAKSGEKKQTNINFEDELVEGELKKPELFYLLQKKQFNFKRLIKLREDFLPEMRRDADEIRRGRSKN